MNSATTPPPINNPLYLTTPECFLSTVPTIVTTKSRASRPFLSLPIRLIHLSHLSSSSSPPSSSSSSWVSLKHKNSPSIVVPLVAQTSSDWAQQEEEGGSSAVDDGFQWGGQAVEASEEVSASSLEGEDEEQERKEGSLDGGRVLEEEGEESYPEPPEEAKLFVGNLPFDFDSEKLAQLFDQAGVVEIAEVIYNRDTDQSRGFGFVTLSTVEEAEKAVEMFHRYELNGRLLTVNKAAPRGSRPERLQLPRAFEPSFRIYVGNLPWQVDNARLEQLFSEHGKVVDARVVYDRETGRSRGFGFVTMATETELNDAIAALDGESLDGRAIRVNVAEERARRSSF